MKLIRFGEQGKEKPGIIGTDGKRKDLSSVFRDWDREFLYQNGLAQITEYLKKGHVLSNVPDQERWGSCVARPGKVLCIGLNYSDHAAETGLPLPKEPIIFHKATNTVVGPYDKILIPRKSVKTDWEVELGVVIGREARYLNSPEEAKECIAGYCISHDVSEREFQLERGGQWTKGKSCDNFNPLGPFLATSDEIKDPHNLAMRLSVNGVLMQNGNTKTMGHDCYYIVHYVSQFMTLEPGDVISTGTPPGVGMGLKPPRYLKEGDVVEMSIDGLGTQKQTCFNA